MANSRTACPGSGAAASRTVARSRTGVSSDASPRIRTGAITIRGPASPGLSTSTTQPSMTVGSSIAGAIGAVTASVLSFATVSPKAKQATSISGSVAVLGHPNLRAANHAPPASTANTANGHKGGSAFSAK